MNPQQEQNTQKSATTTITTTNGCHQSNQPGTAAAWANSSSITLPYILHDMLADAEYAKFFASRMAVRRPLTAPNRSIVFLQHFPSTRKACVRAKAAWKMINVGICSLFLSNGGRIWFFAWFGVITWQMNKWFTFRIDVNTNLWFY